MYKIVADLTFQDMNGSLTNKKFTISGTLEDSITYIVEMIHAHEKHTQSIMIDIELKFETTMVC